MAKEEKFYFSLDIEAVSNTCVVGIGLFVGDSSGEQRFKRAWWLNFDEKDKDEGCWNEFWLNPDNKEASRALMSQGENPSTQVMRFLSVWNGLPTVLGVKEEDIKLISDNPEFDFGRLDSFIASLCDRKDPLRYTLDGKYRSITDFGEPLKFLKVDSILSQKADLIQKHNHCPENDAHHHFLMHLMAKELKKLIQVHLKDQINALALKAAETVLSKKANC